MQREVQCKHEVVVFSNTHTLEHDKSNKKVAKHKKKKTNLLERGSFVATETFESELETLTTPASWPVLPLTLMRSFRKRWKSATSTSWSSATLLKSTEKRLVGTFLTWVGLACYRKEGGGKKTKGKERRGKATQRRNKDREKERGRERKKRGGGRTRERSKRKQETSRRNRCITAVQISTVHYAVEAVLK